ncbi:polyprenyl diphosphate synthase [Streptobacillus moniliformis]|uniref:polyprenyl diphosphate synthase n=1 Tax=Streptobacillus moniliformis TaxID=34105 RepID=UPI0009BD3856
MFIKVMVKEVNILKNYIDKFPKHIGIIMDGNGRWAKQRNLTRTEGHKAGANKLEEIIEYIMDLDIKYLTVYAFSTENWKRPKLEVTAIMKLFTKYLKINEEKFMKEKIRVCISGSRSNLSSSLIKQIEYIENLTKDNDKLVLNIAFNYGGRLEIIDALKKVVAKNLEINENNISNNMYNSFIPDVDLVIRTGNDFRISNFLLWQIAYSEIYVSELLWPDFTKEELHKSIFSFINRERRFGGIKC